MQTIPNFLGQRISKETYFDELKKIRESYKDFLPHIKKYHPMTIDPYSINSFDIMTPLELVFWGQIRFVGAPLYPQFPVGKYYVDFADPVVAPGAYEKVAIEIDGSHHESEEQKEKDQVKDEYLTKNGWMVYRFTARDIYFGQTEDWIRGHRDYLLMCYGIERPPSLITIYNDISNSKKEMIDG